MNFLVADYETYWADQFTLKKLIPPNYILDARFRTHLLAYQWGLDGEPDLVVGPDVNIQALFKRIAPATTITITFNALFDNCIMAWRHGFVPGLMIDVMGMARALRGHKQRHFSLSACAETEGLSEKGTALLKTKGLTLEQIRDDQALWEDYREYAKQDVRLTAQLFKIYAAEFPKSEYSVMDLVLRCAVQPKLCIDKPMLAQHIADLEKEKQAMLDLAKTDKDTLMSAAGFQRALEALGVEVEYKITPAGNEAPAFAKTDDFMAALQVHDDPAVQALVAARLGHKSTLEETRGNRMLALTDLDWSNTGQLGNFPFSLRYAAAHTHRLGGDWKLNPQNLPRQSPHKPSKLRKALIAPAGHSVVTADLRQIEARITAWICGQSDLMAAFETGDPYNDLGSKIFGFAVNRKVHKIEGHIGKGGVLGLGFGCGWSKFYRMVIMQARSMGLDVAKLLEIWTESLAKKAVYTYRRANQAITGTWPVLDYYLESAWVGKTAAVRFGPCEIGEGYVRGPNGLEMRYSPRAQGDQPGYTYGGVWHKIYGSAFLENIVQFLARIIFMNAAVRLARLGYVFAGQVHDELIFVVPTADLDRAKKVIHTEMIRRPSWAQDLPVDTELGSGPSYGDAK